MNGLVALHENAASHYPRAQSSGSIKGQDVSPGMARENESAYVDVVSEIGHGEGRNNSKVKGGYGD